MSISVAVPSGIEFVNSNFLATASTLMENILAGGREGYKAGPKWILAMYLQSTWPRASLE